MILEEIIGHSVTMYANSIGISNEAEEISVLAALNARLQNDGRSWRVRLDDFCLTFYDL